MPNKSLGSNEKPVLLSSKKNKGRLYSPASHGGKGAAPRFNVNSEKYYDDYDRIFKQGKYSKQTTDTDKVEDA